MRQPAVLARGLRSSGDDAKNGREPDRRGRAVGDLPRERAFPEGAEGLFRLRQLLHGAGANHLSNRWRTVGGHTMSVRKIKLASGRTVWQARVMLDGRRRSVLRSSYAAAKATQADLLTTLRRQGTEVEAVAAAPGTVRD